jgi:non-specific serine/threonine protein kinase
VGKALAALADHSRLRRTWEGDEPRFGMLQSIREYALELLDNQGLLAEIARRHADYFAGLVDQATAERHGRHEAIWMQRVGAELGNLRAAMAWGLGPAADAARAVVGARLVRGLGEIEFWGASGRLSEGRRWSEQALHHRRWLDVRLYAELLMHAGWLAQLQGDFPAADAAYQEGLALARQIDDRVLILKCLNYLGIAAGRQGDYERAQALFSEAIAICREDSGGEVTHRLIPLLANLAIVARHHGECDRAVALLEESLAFLRAQGTLGGIATCLASLSNVAIDQQDYARAEAAARESLQIQQALDNKTKMAITLTRLADLALFNGQPVRSARLFGAFHAWQETTGFAPGTADHEEEERRLAALRELLGEADYAAAWASGASMSLEQAVAYALG